VCTGNLSKARNPRVGKSLKQGEQAQADSDQHAVENTEYQNSECRGGSNNLVPSEPPKFQQRGRVEGVEQRRNDDAGQDR
jgi:hypothetical protein